MAPDSAYVAIASGISHTTSEANVSHAPILSHKLGPLGAEPELSETASMVQESVHRYAEEVMRPVGIKLDRMAPAEAIAPASPYWKARGQFNELGFGIDTLLSLEPAERAKTMCILFEELGWGDAGLAISFGAGMLPALMSATLGNAFCRELATDEKLGCWAITEPDHGSDMLDANRMIFHPQGTYGRPNCVATLRGDDGCRTASSPTCASSIARPIAATVPIRSTASWSSCPWTPKAFRAASRWTRSASGR